MATEPQSHRVNQKRISFIFPCSSLCLCVSVSMPCRKSQSGSVDDGEPGGLIQAAEPSLAFLIIDDGGENVRAAEIGPQRIRHINLRVSDLPQQEITHAHLA